MKYLAVCAGVVFCFVTAGMFAQVASGNVAESSHPRADVLAAQNSPVHRSVEGCILQQGNEYLVSAKHIGLIRLTANSAGLLSQKVGQRVKLVGHLEPLVVADADEDKPAATNPVREMQVERIESVSGACR